MKTKSFLLVLLAISSAFVISNVDASKYKFHDKYEGRSKDDSSYNHKDDGYDKNEKHSVLKANFYHKTCPCVEEIVQDAIKRHVSSNTNLPAKLSRMFFHDCFVRLRIRLACFVYYNHH